MNKLNIELENCYGIKKLGSSPKELLKTEV